VCPCIFSPVQVLAESPSYAAGSGRGAPNANPELPEPTGRFDPSQAFSPYYLLKNSFGTNLIRSFGAAIACGMLVVVVVAVGPLVMGLLSLASETTNGWGYHAFYAVILLLILGCCGVRFKCVRNADFDPCESCCSSVCPCDFARPKSQDSNSDEESDEEAPLLAGGNLKSGQGSANEGGSGEVNNADDNDSSDESDGAGA